MTRMTRSRPRIVHFFGPDEPEPISEPNSEDGEISDSDGNWGTINKEKIKAPNFLMDIDDSDDDMDRHSTPATPALPAEFVSESSTSPKTTQKTSRKQSKKRKQRHIVESDDSEPETSPSLRSRHPKRKPRNVNLPLVR